MLLFCVFSDDYDYDDGWWSRVSASNVNLVDGQMPEGQSPGAPG